MKIVNIKYFAKSNDGISGSDFQNQERELQINLMDYSSLTDLELFTLPFSGNPMDYFSILTMRNGDRFYIKQDEYRKLLKIMDKYLVS